MERSTKTLEKDLTDIAGVVEGSKNLMGSRYAEKFDERGSYMEETCERILENLSRNVMQLANAIHNKDYKAMANQSADIFNLTAIIILRVDDCHGT